VLHRPSQPHHLGVDGNPANATHDPVDLRLNVYAPTVGALRSLDPVTTEVVRLRGAVQHNCRLCKSLREGTALDAGGTESMYADIENYETSPLLDERRRPRCGTSTHSSGRRQRLMTTSRRGAGALLRRRSTRDHLRRDAQRHQQDRGRPRR